jgi:hypothetical protein
MTKSYRTRSGDNVTLFLDTPYHTTNEGFNQYVGLIARDPDKAPTIGIFAASRNPGSSVAYTCVDSLGGPVPNPEAWDLIEVNPWLEAKSNDPILVYPGTKRLKMHFAAYDPERNRIYWFPGGTTSFSAPTTASGNMPHLPSERADNCTYVGTSGLALSEKDLSSLAKLASPVSKKPTYNRRRDDEEDEEEDDK